MFPFILGEQTSRTEVRHEVIIAPELQCLLQGVCMCVCEEHRSGKWTKRLIAPINFHKSASEGNSLKKNECGMKIFDGRRFCPTKLGSS